MTIVINGTITIDPARKDEAYAAAVAMQEATWKEAGCLHYVFSADLSDPSKLHIAEKWVSMDDLNAHFTEPHMATFGAAMKGIIQGVNVVKYEIASEGPVR